MESSRLSLLVSDRLENQHECGFTWRHKSRKYMYFIELTVYGSFQDLRFRRHFGLRLELSSPCSVSSLTSSGLYRILLEP
jgi:hypothetical protein